MSTPTRNFPPTRRLILLFTIGAIVALVVLPFNPLHNTLTKAGYLLAVGVAYLGLLVVFWKKISLRLLGIALGIGISIPFLLPGRPIDTAELNQRYLHEIRGFEGCPYHWGGESRRGIDCSGLPRRALIKALLHQGVFKLNAKSLRRAASLWWYDSSAKAIAEGYRGETVPLGVEGKMREIDLSKLLPGDLAVTKGGAHLLVYQGDGNWIQADPGPAIVLTQNVTRDDNPWFSYRVTTHQWAVLNAP